jgi:hypothetical protein
VAAAWALRAAAAAAAVHLDEASRYNTDVIQRKCPLVSRRWQQHGAASGSSMLQAKLYMDVSQCLRHKYSSTDTFTWAKQAGIRMMSQNRWNRNLVMFHADGSNMAQQVDHPCSSRRSYTCVCICVKILLGNEPCSANTTLDGTCAMLKELF